MLLRLYCSSKYIPDQDTNRRWPILQRCNQGFSLVIYMLWLLNSYCVDFEIIDTTTLIQEQRYEIYKSVIPIAAAKKYSIRRVFGTKHQSGIRFGVEVPALLVYEENNTNITDIYPRGWNPDYRRSDIVTISQYVNGLLRKVLGDKYKQADRIVDYRNFSRRVER